MKIAIIADVHANIHALKATLSKLEEKGYDYLACLGDVVGYGGEPNLCCDLLREKTDITVLGNHDAAVAGRMGYDYYRAAARKALETHRRVLSKSNLQWLESLPFEGSIEGVRFCHGVPPELDAFDYLFAMAQVQPLIHEYEKHAFLTFVGHSHLCKAFSYTADMAHEVLRTRFTLETGRKYIISAGSVGQPRDYDARSCSAIYDTETRRFEFVRVPYDIEAAAEQIYASNLSDAFARRLFVGV